MDLDDLLDENLRLGLIEPADEGAEWASPAFPVRKTSKGKWRLVVDYHEVKEATIRDEFPVPIIEQILEKVRARSHLQCDRPEIRLLPTSVRSWVDLREKHDSLQRQFSSEKSFAISAEMTANSRDSGASDVARINTGKRQSTSRRPSPLGAATFNQFQRHNSASNRSFERNNPAAVHTTRPSFATAASKRVTRFSVANPSSAAVRKAWCETRHS